MQKAHFLHHEQEGQCRDQLQQAEQQVVQLMQGDDGAPVETGFVSEE